MFNREGGCFLIILTFTSAALALSDDCTKFDLPTRNHLQNRQPDGVLRYQRKRPAAVQNLGLGDGD